MKKTYATPTIIACGNIVDETKHGGPMSEVANPIGTPVAPGSVGFYL